MAVRLFSSKVKHVMKMVGVGSLVEAYIIYEKERNSRRKERSISTTPPISPEKKKKLAQKNMGGSSSP